MFRYYAIRANTEKGSTEAHLLELAIEKLITPFNRQLAAPPLIANW